MKKHIICFGDSNTHGYAAVPADTADGIDRFSEAERWTCLLQKALGEEYLICEEGLSGRTTVFDDPLTEGLCGLQAITPVLMTHEPVELLILMLGTNDLKERFGVSPHCIGMGLERLICKAKATECWGPAGPRILVIAPPHIGEGMKNHPCVQDMGVSAIEKSRGLAGVYQQVCQARGCAFLDAEGIGQFNDFDCMHLTKQGHSQLASALAALIPELLR